MHKTEQTQADRTRAGLATPDEPGTSGQHDGFRPESSAAGKPDASRPEISASGKPDASLPETCERQDGPATGVMESGDSPTTGSAESGDGARETGAALLAAAAGLILLLLFVLGGCAARDADDARVRADIEARHKSFDRHTSPHTFTESSGPYLRGKLVGRRSDRLDTPLMRTKVTLKQRGTLAEIAASLGRLAPVSALVEDSAAAGPNQTGPVAGTRPAGTGPLAGGDDLLVPGLGDLLPGGAGQTVGGDVLDVNYTGTLRGLLDTLAALSGHGWDYEAAGSRITFARMQVRTFVLSAMVGTVTWDSQVSNKSREQRSNNISSGSINSTVTSGDTSTQTAQVNATRASLDVWKDVERTVRSLLSREGTMAVNQAAGTLTVRDTHARLRDVERYVTDLNARLERQIALSVRVWALEVSDETGVGLNLQTLFSSPDVFVQAGSATQAAGNLATVSILKGSLSGSSAALEAMKAWGHATQLTSASGLVMNNQPFPVQAVRRHAYLAGMTMSTSEYSQTSEITPGEVTTGFAMTLVPHILPDRHVLLQYNITLSSLEDMTTIEREGVAVQLPQVSTRAFSQRTRLKAGQTLVLAGFEQDTRQATRNLGLLSAGRAREGNRTLLVISIELEGADNV